jgi:ABC-type amino acid transport substrate-binding protein/serine phosphatase RsbU (regulator of sigma subunit)
LYKRIIVILVIILGSTNLLAQDGHIQFTEAEQTWIDNNPVVYHGYDPEWKPIDYVDEAGNYAGIAADYLELISSRIGIEFKPYPGIETWEESLDLLKEEKVLFLPGLAQNHERSLFMDFTQTYSSYSFVIVTRKDGDFIGGIEDLDNKKVSMPISYYSTGLLEQEQINIDFVYKTGAQECLMAVSTGEAEATVANLGVMSYYLNYAGFENLKIAAPADYPSIEIKMGVSKHQPILLEILKKGIESVTVQEKNKIIQEWISVEYEHGVDMTKVWTIGGIAIGLGLIILGAFIFYHRKIRKEIRLRIEAQSALNASFDEINDQKAIIEHKNDEVMSSITYAERLQNAVLPTLPQIYNALPKSFVLFLPKDIVSGDFYFLETKDNGNRVFFTAADCTGHGVPGAMVSLVCSNALHQAVTENDIDKPSDILDFAKHNLEKRFERSGENIKDGMDISFCTLDVKYKKLMFAGAYNPLWIVRSNNLISETNQLLDRYEDHKPTVLEGDNYHLIEVRADRQPVAKYDYYKPFTNHEIDLLDGDTVYLSSDGYADQFGGEKGKKMKSKNFKKLLLSIQDQTMLKQHDTLQKQFFDWKSDYEQIDDVCVFGVKI